jgi:dephospho-CoA kinase
LAKPEGFKCLEAIVHPLVVEAERSFLQAAAASGAAMAVLEIPLLLETAGRARVDLVVVCSAPAEAQRERVMRRQGMTPEKLEQLLSRQMPDAEKRRLADFVVDTGGMFEETDTQVDTIVESLEGRQGTAYARFWA